LQLRVAPLCDSITLAKRQRSDITAIAKRRRSDYKAILMRLQSDMQRLQSGIAVIAKRCCSDCRAKRGAAIAE
jgi:hypothetical protein